MVLVVEAVDAGELKYKLKVEKKNKLKYFIEFLIILPWNYILLY